MLVTATLPLESYPVCGINFFVSSSTSLQSVSNSPLFPAPITFLVFYSCSFINLTIYGSQTLSLWA